MDCPEISDAIVDFDAQTLKRRPVQRQALIDRFLADTNRRAARIISELKHHEGVLDPDAVDRLLVTVHYEMQQLAEEFFHGQRMSEYLCPLVSALRSGGASRPLRVVDVGCGIGYVVRWLAAHTDLSENVELIGIDFNPALISEAQSLAEQENLRCSFTVSNAFQMTEPASVYLSTGVLHHFRDDGLQQFFSQHNRPETLAFAHFDFQPSIFAPIGAWFFHLVRMREVLARHDGVASAIRAHSAATLLSAAQSGTDGMLTAMFNTHLWKTPAPRVMHAVVGIRPEFETALIEHLGPHAGRLGALS